MSVELVRSQISQDTVEALAQLLDEAREGRYTGFVIGLTRSRNRYTVHCVGEACRRPTWAAGIATKIMAELGGMIEGEVGETTF